MAGVRVQRVGRSDSVSNRFDDDLVAGAEAGFSQRGRPACADHPPGRCASHLLPEGPKVVYSSESGAARRAAQVVTVVVSGEERLSQPGRALDSRYRINAALLAVVTSAAAVCCWLMAATAHAAVPAYQSFEVPAPEPQAAAGFGERLRTLGDVDGDGRSDVLISASNYDGKDASGGVLRNSGRVYLFSGRTRALLRTLEAPLPQADAKFGFWDANLGDVDGDGAADFVTSAPSQVIGGAKVGQVSVYSGRTGTQLRTISPPESLGATGTFGGDFGGNLIAPGDLTGDGATDFVATSSGAFGGAGAAYAFNGKTGAFLYKVANPDATQASSFGFGAAELGDVNADGVNDYQVGAPLFDEGAVLDVGRCYVISGKTGAVLFTLKNPEPEAADRFGQADADGISLGDVDGDGRPDIFVDSFLGNEHPAAGPALDNAGKAFFFSGATGGFIGVLRDPAPERGRAFAASNAGAGDIDGDGRPDAIISSRGGGGEPSIGRATVFGGPGLGTVLKTFEDPSRQGGALFGTGLAFPGDVNGDKLPDYFISARSQDVGGVLDVGTAYAYISQAPAATPTPQGTPPPAPTIPGPTPRPPMTPAASVMRQRPGLSVSVSPRRDPRLSYRFTTRGTVKLPSGVSKAKGCTGTVRVTVRPAGQGKVLSSRLAKLGNSCRFSSELRISDRRRLGKRSRGTLRFTVRFQGNSRLLPRQVTLTARYG